MRATTIVILFAMVAGQLWAGPKRHEPGALVLVLDRSASMKGTKLDALKDAAIAGVGALDPNDQVAIIAVDHEADVVVPLQRAANRQEIAKKIARLEAGGGTNVLPGLRAAVDVLHHSKFKVKHVIFVSDGETPSEGISELMKEMRGADITLSAVGVEGADRNLLAMMADVGEGRLYLVGDTKALSKVVVKEIKTALP